MRNLFALLGFVIVIAAAVGWHQGWYKLSVTKNSDGTLRVQTDVNTNRASDDIVVWGKNVGEWIKNKPSSATATAPTQPTPQAAPAPDTTSERPRPLREGAGWLMGNVLGSK